MYKSSVHLSGASSASHKAWRFAFGTEENFLCMLGQMDRGFDGRGLPSYLPWYVLKDPRSRSIWIEDLYVFLPFQEVFFLHSCISHRCLANFPKSFIFRNLISLRYLASSSIEWAFQSTPWSIFDAESIVFKQTDDWRLSGIIGTDSGTLSSFLSHVTVCYFILLGGIFLIFTYEYQSFKCYLFIKYRDRVFLKYLLFSLTLIN